MATKKFTMKTHNGTGWDVQYPKTSMEQVEGLNTKISEVEAVAKGASRAKVFDTVAALDTWLAVAANKATLQIGDNFYIKAKEVPDYWWDGTAKQELEGAKVALENATTSNDGLMSKSDKSKLNGIADGATKVTSPSDIGAVPTTRKVNEKALSADITLTASDVGAATTAQGTKADSAYQKPADGIPKADLATAVQTSLGKADSALQSVPDANTTTKGIALLGATNGAARYGQKGDVGLGNVPNTDATNAANISSGILPAARLGVPIITTGTIAPTSPKVGDIWYDENNN